MTKVEYVRSILVQESVIWYYIRPTAVYKDMVPSTFHRKVKGEIKMTEEEADWILGNIREAVEFLTIKLEANYEWL